MSVNVNVKIKELTTNISVISKGTETYFSNCHIKPYEKIEFIDGSGDEVYNCEVTVFYDPEDPELYDSVKITLDNEALTNIQVFKRIHNSLIVTPYAQFMPALKAYVLTRFRKLHRAGEAFIRKGVRSSGVIYNTDLNKVEYCINDYSTGDIVAHQQVPLMSEFYTKKLKPIEKVADYVRGIISLHYSYITATKLCWCAAVMAKGFSDKPVKNPTMFSYGCNNSGKSSLDKNIVGRLFDMKSSAMTHQDAEPEQLFCNGQSVATLQRHASASNVVPLLLDEFKYFQNSQLRDAMSDLIRNNYDQTTASKAKDFSAAMVHYNIVRPIALTGESTFGDEQAIMNRQIIIQHKRFTDEHMRNFRDFDFSKMKVLGNMMFDMLFKKKKWSWVKQDFDSYRKYNIDSRNYENMDFLYNGRAVINEVCGEEVITDKMFKDMTDHYVAFLLSEDVSEVEEMLSLLDLYVKDNTGKSGVLSALLPVIHYDKGSLYMTMTPVFDKIRQFGIIRKKKEMYDLLSKVGMVRHVNVKCSKMHKHAGQILQFNAAQFFSKIDRHKFRNLFQDIDIDDIENNEIQTMLYEV